MPGYWKRGTRRKKLYFVHSFYPTGKLLSARYPDIQRYYNAMRPEIQKQIARQIARETRRTGRSTVPGKASRVYSYGGDQHRPRPSNSTSTRGRRQGSLELVPRLNAAIVKFFEFTKTCELHKRKKTACTCRDLSDFELHYTPPGTTILHTTEADHDSSPGGSYGAARLQANEADDTFLADRLYEATRLQATEADYNLLPDGSYGAAGLQATQNSHYSYLTTYDTHGAFNAPVPIPPPDMEDFDLTQSQMEAEPRAINLAIRDLMNLGTDINSESWLDLVIDLPNQTQSPNPLSDLLCIGQRYDIPSFQNHFWCQYTRDSTLSNIVSGCVESSDCTFATENIHDLFDHVEGMHHALLSDERIFRWTCKQCTAYSPNPGYILETPCQLPGHTVDRCFSLVAVEWYSGNLRATESAYTDST